MSTGLSVKPSVIVRPKGQPFQRKLDQRWTYYWPGEPVDQFKAGMKLSSTFPIGGLRYHQLDIAFPRKEGYTYELASIDLDKQNRQQISAYAQWASFASLSDDSIGFLHVEKDGMKLTEDEVKSRLGYTYKISDLGKLAKRVRRELLQPQMMFYDGDWAEFESKHVVYLRRTFVHSAADDGNGQITRRMFKWIVRQTIRREYAPHMIEGDPLREYSQRMAANLMGMAKHAQRVTYTVTCPDGQHKGDLAVVDKPGCYFGLFREQVKSELKTSNGQVHVGLYPVHACEGNMDRQMHVNINTPVDFPIGKGVLSFDPGRPEVDRVIEWQREYLEFKKSRIMSDEYLQEVAEIADNTRFALDFERLVSRPVVDFIVRGGDPRWFKGTIMPLLRQPIKEMDAVQGEFRMKVPAQRLAVIDGALYGERVQRGYAMLAHDSFLCNSLDLVTLDHHFSSMHQLQSEYNRDCEKGEAVAAWLERHGYKPGIFTLAGGGDGDDKGMTFPVINTEADDRREVWWIRSPSTGPKDLIRLLWQSGEPAEFCGHSAWFKVCPSLIRDTDDIKFLDLVGEPAAKAEWTIANVKAAAFKMIDSGGSVGIHCLFLRMCRSIHGDIRKTLSATTEQVIDGTVKFFADMEAVKAFDIGMMDELAEDTMRLGLAVPATFSEDLKTEQPFRVADWEDGHWVDRIQKGVAEVVDQYERDIELLGNACRPPEELYVKGFRYADAGRRLHGIWSQYWRQILENQEPVEEETASAIHDDDVQDAVDDETERENLEANHDEARALMSEFLAQFPDEIRPLVMVGALADEYSRRDVDEALKDAFAWQLGEKLLAGQGRGFGMGNMTTLGLEAIGLLGHVRWDKNEHVLIDKADKSPEGIFCVTLSGVWFNLAIARGKPYERMSQVPEVEREILKSQTRSLLFPQSCGTEGAGIVGKQFYCDFAQIATAKGVKEVPAVVSCGTNKVLGILKSSQDTLDVIPDNFTVVAGFVDHDDLCHLVIKAE